MKKRTLALFLAGIMSLSLVACSSSSDTSSSSSSSSTTSSSSSSTTTTTEAAEEEVECTTIKFNFSKSTNDVTYGFWSEVFDEIYEKSGGTVYFEIYPSEALGTIPDTIELASKGEYLMADGDLAYLEPYVPELGIGLAPYLMQKPEDIEVFWTSDVGQRLFGELEEAGLKCISLSYFGTRQTILVDEAYSRDDLLNLRIRCAAAPMWNEVVRVLGGNPTNTAWSEVYQAMSQGVADGLENPLAQMYDSKLYEPCKYVLMTDHVICSTVLVMSVDVYNSLPQQAQDAIEEVMLAYCDKSIENIDGETDRIQALLEEEGVTFIEVDKTPFIEAAQDTPDYFDWTPGLYEEIKEALGY